MTATATCQTAEPVVVAYHDVIAKAQAEWFAFTGNSHYEYLSRTPSVYRVEVLRTINGEYYVSARYSPAHIGVHAFHPRYRSNAFATEAEARREANRVYTYLRHDFIMESGARARTTVAVAHQGLAKGRTWVGDTFGQICPLPTGEPAYTAESLCPECQHFGTLHTRQEAYGDSTTCSTPDCTYSRWYSIGD